ncbi:MAG TPA: AI-2E family transporter [Pilimelia sp.]|nr:AI-2E family transporter [Pilimelia sp.]
MAETPAPVMADDQPAGPPATAGRPATEEVFGRPGRPLSRNPFVVGFVGGLGALLAYATYLAVRSATSMLVLIFIALFLAVALNPAVRRLQGWGLSRGVAVMIVGFGTVLVFCGGLFALVPPIITQSSEFTAELPEYIQDLKSNSTLNELNDRFDIIDKVTAAANGQNATRLFGGVLGGARLVFGTLFNVFTVFVLTLYFMAAFERLKTGAYRLVPASRRPRVELLGDEILGKVGAYMVGALAIALVAGTSTFIFLWICGVAYKFALAFVVAICDLIPQIGATLGAIVVSVVCFATSIPVGIAAVVFFVIYQQVENYIIYPRVMRRSVHVTDLAAIVAALLGVALLGVIGALIAIPTVAAIQLVVREVVLPRQEQH